MESRLDTEIAKRPFDADGGREVVLVVGNGLDMAERNP